MDKKSLVCKWSRFLIGFEIWKPNHFKSGQMAAIGPSQKAFEILMKMSGFQMVQISNAWDLSYSKSYNPDPLKTGPFENRTIWKDLHQVPISNNYGFQMV